MLAFPVGRSVRDVRPWLYRTYEGEHTGNGWVPTGGGVVYVTLSDDLVKELRETIGSALDDLSGEIADTDNPGYRLTLNSRRDRLHAILGLLGPA